MTDVTLDREPTELYKILKFEGVASSGAVAKQMIADGLVRVNGDIDTRKRRKIVAGDQILIGDESLTIILAG